MQEFTTDVKKARTQANDGELEQRTEMYPWNTFRGGFGCCGLVPQLVLAGALGSFMFGFNIALLNTAVSSVNSNFLQCGPVNPEYVKFKSWTSASCSSNPVCKSDCGVFGDPSKPDLITELRCPGGYNDLSCPSLKWYNAFLGCAILIGAAIGSMTGGRYLVHGRRLVLMVTMAIFILGVISSVCANSFSALMWARLIVGYGVGLVSVACPTYMSEVTPPNQRGRYGVFHQLFIVIGIFIPMFLGLPLAAPSEQDDTWVPDAFQRSWWRVMVALGLLPAVAGLYLFGKVYPFETPVYYVEQKRYKDAAELLKRIYGKCDVREELNNTVENVQQGEENKKNGLTFRSAFADPEYRHVIIVGMVLSAFQQFGGINVFMTSSSDLFKKAGLTGTMQTAMSIIMSTINLLMTFPTIYLIERMGRKSLLFIGSLMQFLAVVPAAISYWTEADPSNPSGVTQILAIVAVLGFVVFFAVAYGPVLWVYLFEIYPMEIKDTAASVATCCNWISGIVMVFAAIVLPNQISFSLFAGLQLIGTLCIFFLMKETKGRPLGESPFVTKRVQHV